MAKINIHYPPEGLSKKHLCQSISGEATIYSDSSEIDTNAQYYVAIYVEGYKAEIPYRNLIEVHECSLNLSRADPKPQKATFLFDMWIGRIPNGASLLSIELLKIDPKESYTITSLDRAILASKRIQFSECEVTET